MAVLAIFVKVLKTSFNQQYRNYHQASQMIEPQPKQKYLSPARTLRAPGLLLADGAPTVRGGRLFEPSTGFFYGNSCNSGTESRKIDPNWKLTLF